MRDLVSSHKKKAEQYNPKQSKFEHHFAEHTAEEWKQRTNIEFIELPDELKFDTFSPFDHLTSDRWSWF